MSNTSMKNHDRKASYSSLAALVRSGLENFWYIVSSEQRNGRLDRKNYDLGGM